MILPLSQFQTFHVELDEEQECLVGQLLALLVLLGEPLDVFGILLNYVDVTLVHLGFPERDSEFG